MVGFDPEGLKAPFLLRCGALFIDYIVLIVIPVVTLLLARWLGYDGSKLLNSALSNSGWLASLFLAVANLIVLPAIIGQSVGKYFTGLRIVNKEGAVPSIGAVLLRHFVGYGLTILTGGLGFLWAAVARDGRALHDYLAGTLVVFGRTTVSEKRYVKKGKNQAAA